MIPKTIIEKAIPTSKRDFMRRPQTWYPHPNEEGMSLAFIQFKGEECGVLVDYNDLPKVMVYRWYLQNGYAVTSIAGKRVKMHHLIMGKPPKGMEYDHENRFRLDNTRSNLRLVSHAANAKNVLGKGYRKRGNKWVATICTDYKQIHLGTFDTEHEAKAVYQRAKSAQLEAI